ncbi:Paraplegin [Verticillium dahliae VDG2]|nr:Paraplegin [Verticillium dahliae VDG2]
MSSPAAQRPAGRAAPRPAPVDTFSQGTLAASLLVSAVAYAVIAGIMGLLIGSQEVSAAWPGRLGPVFAAGVAALGATGVYVLVQSLPRDYYMLALLNGSFYAGMLAEAVTGVTGLLVGGDGAKAPRKQD